MSRRLQQQRLHKVNNLFLPWQQHQRADVHTGAPTDPDGTRKAACARQMSSAASAATAAVKGELNISTACVLGVRLRCLDCAASL